MTASGSAPAWPIDLWEWSTEEVAFRQNSNLLLTNSPMAFALFYGVRAAGNALARRRAEQQAQPQWRPLGGGQAAMADWGIHLTGPWGSAPLAFDQLVSWERTPDGLVLHAAGDLPPFLLRSPAADQLAAELFRTAEGRTWRAPELEVWPPPDATQTAGWEPADGRFGFAISPGWHRHHDARYLQLAANDMAEGGQQLLFSLRFDTAECDAFLDVAELRDPERLALLAGDATWVERNAFSLVQVRAQKSNGMVTGPPRLVAVGGERASLLGFTTTVPGFQVRNAEFWIPHHGAWFVFDFSILVRGDPRPWFDHLFPGVQAMLASWQWYTSPGT